MTVKSYAQNFEDVLLWRALKKVVGGRYVDVGAGHPDFNSVTKLFYDAGWSGINIEPLPSLAAVLNERRPRDLNVQAAVSSRKSEVVEFTIVSDWDELSTISGERARTLAAAGRALKVVEVPVVRLDKLLDEHGLSDIQFLKVDVEGAELDVLKTLDFARVRPWIVVVEVVSPGATERSRGAIRAHMDRHDYLQAYFDGLNDFYVAKERANSLLDSFATPINVTDDFIAVANGDSVFLEIAGERLGMSAPVQSSEALQRIDALIRERIDFETRFNLSEGAASASDLAGSKEVEAAQERQAALESREQELLEADRVQRAQLHSLDLQVEALEQSSFERERMVAAYASEVSNIRNRLKRHDAAFAAHIDRQASDARGVQSRLDDVLGSTSWRITLPMRAVRRPRTYLKAWMRR